MTITTDTSVGQIAAEHPLATKVFERLDIDYCCGGTRSLAEVCTQMGLDASATVEDIHKEIETSESSEERWDEAPLEDLIDHILATYHRALDEELPRLQIMAEKVCEVHRDKAPETLPALFNVYLELKEELEHHMMKEERILFPMIKQGQGSMGGPPISVMMHEHESAAAALTRLRELTNDYQVPDEACNTWRALWHGLEALEKSLHQHIHLENNILFPRALRE